MLSKIGMTAALLYLTLSTTTRAEIDYHDGIAMPQPKIILHRPYRLTGVLSIGDKKFEYVSGGAGASIPFGDHRITPEDVGRWGSRHGALGINGDSIPDPQLGRDREGIEIHPLHGDRTEGCVGIRDGFDKLKKAIVAMIDTAGKAFLHIGPDGAAITPDETSPLPPFIYIASRGSDRSGSDDKKKTDASIDHAGRALALANDNPSHRRHVALAHRYHHYHGTRYAEHRHRHGRHYAKAD